MRMGRHVAPAEGSSDCGGQGVALVCGLETTLFWCVLWAEECRQEATLAWPGRMWLAQNRRGGEERNVGEQPVFLTFSELG